jgi:hypothetical protein
MTAAWLEFWDGSHTTFVNSRHKDVHYRLIAKDVAQLVSSPQARVMPTRLLRFLRISYCVRQRRELEPNWPHVSAAPKEREKI